ncbi:hypothetical protein [Nitrospirillum sp. BR 11828]|uniref:hypothetical protein n=1 Tax=Nitrospirillum sp. BR 11828 TaxID=3104325 RepID=UPI002ACAF24E|nr:hypothetical protein [Nitrospirillum sp. BR 11828]MDZ5649080.1 hypothetical protein [Nitrospirillum sp. BR 11828]
MSTPWAMETGPPSFAARPSFSDDAFGTRIPLFQLGRALSAIVFYPLCWHDGFKSQKLGSGPMTKSRQSAIHKNQNKFIGFILKIGLEYSKKAQEDRRANTARDALILKKHSLPPQKLAAGTNGHEAPG